MVYRDLDKQALKENGYTVLSKITLLNDNSVFTEDDFIVNWNYEDYRYVPNTGFIGQFVERILDGNLQNIPDNKIFENQEINLQLGIVNGIDDQTTWYDYGNFLITKVEKTDTTGNYKFESADYTKKFNKEYDDTITYPCLAMDLANNVCNQAGVYLDTINYAYYYIVSENGLVAGDYSFKINEMYYRFTLSEDLIKNDVLVFIASENQLILKKVRDYEVTRTLLEYAQSPSADAYTPLDIRTTGYINFANNDFVIENNQYDEKDTLRKVMQDIGKLAYSWVRVGEDNKVHIDFEQVEKENVDNYDKLTTNEYYVSKKSDLAFGPVNKVVLGMSNIEGESLYKTSEDYTEETECAIRIFDNNLTYTDELRAIALNGCERLFGIEYTPIEIETIGHPWLDGDELIKLTNVDDEEVYTYPFNRSITYAGYIDGKIGAEASSKQNNEYEYESEIVKQINKTSITVDKNNKTITALVSDVNDAQSDIAQLYITSDEISATVEHLDDEYENNVIVSREAEGNPIEIDNGGNYPLEDFKIYGGTTQEQTTMGKNLLGLVNGTYSDAGITAIVNNSTLSISGTANSTTTTASLIDIPILPFIKSSLGILTKSLNRTGTYTGVQTSLRSSSTSSVGLWSTDGANQSGTISADAYYFRVQINNGISVNCTFKCQVETGTTATSFEPFIPNSPSPDYPQEVQNVTSKKSTVSYSGSNIDVNYDYDTDLEKVEREDLKLEGDTTQETISGKNLFNPNATRNQYSGTSESNLSTGKRITCSSNGAYLYSNYVITNLTNYVGKKVRLKCNISASASNIGTYGIGVCASDGTNRTAKKTTAVSGETISFDVGTLATNQEYLYVILYGNAGGEASSITSYVDYTNIILTIDNSNMDYVPYVGGTDSPNPDYPQPIQVVTGNQEIEVCGKNLLDNNAITLGGNWNGGVGTTCYPFNSQATRAVVLIPVKPSATYHLTLQQSAWYVMQTIYTDSNYTILYNNLTSSNQNQLNITLNTTSKTSYIGFKFKYGTAGTTNITSDLLSELKIQLETGNQSTTYEPYTGNKYEINLGKNLLNMPNGTYSNNGIEAVVDNGVITLNGTATSNSYININLITNIVLNGGNYTYSLNNATTGTTEIRLFDTNNSYTSLWASSINNKRINSDSRTFNLLSIATTSGNTLNNLVLKPQLEKGSVATSFSPYFTPIELCKIGNYKDSIYKGKGINLFDKDSATTNKRVNSNDGTIGDMSGISCSDYIDISNTNSLYLSGNKTSQNKTSYQCAFYNDNKEYISGISTTMNAIMNNRRIDVPNNAKYIIFNFVSADKDTMQLEKNSTGTQYEPYNAKDKWYIYKEIGKIVIDGTQNVNNPTGSTFANLYFLYTNQWANMNYDRGGWCDYFKYVHSDSVTANSSANQNLGDNQMCFRMGSTKDRLYFKTSLYSSSPSDVKTWFGTHPTSLYYVLATPTCTEITNQDLINQLNELENCEFNLGLNHYITSSPNLSVISDFSINSLTYEVITITDENESQLSYRPLFRNLELCKIGNYQDYIYLKQGKWYKHSEIGKVILDGSENWNYNTNNAVFALSDYIDYLRSGFIPYSNYYKGANIDNYSQMLDNEISCLRSTTNNRLVIKNTSLGTGSSSIKTWLQSNPTSLYYVLADSTETEITDEEIVSELTSLMQSAIYQGYNKIYLNDEICEKLYIKYLTNSIFNDTYATRAQLAITNENVSAIVSKSNSLESNLAELQVSVDGITTAVESVETLTANLENSINYLAVDMSANSVIIPTNDEKRPYLSTTYTIPFTATFKGDAVNPTVTTSSPTITGITLTFGTNAINVGVSSTTAIDNLSNSYVINFSYTSEGETYLVSKTLNVALSVKGEDGKDGTSVTILGSYNTLAELQAAHPTGSAGDSYMVGNDLYVWNVSSLAWVDVGQIKGTDGTSSYVYIRYSENQDGNPMVTVPTTSTKYIGVCSTTSSTAPTSYSSYTWSKYSGNDGETTYLHIKYSEDGTTFVPASADVDEGDTPSAWVGILTDTNEVASTNFNDYEWYKFTEDIDDAINKMQSDIKQNSTDITNKYKAIMEDLNDYAKADVVGKLTKRVETIESDDEFVISAISDLQVNGVSQVRTEKGFTFNDNGMTIDANNSITKSVTDTNGIQVLDKSGSSQTELMFAGYDEASQTSIVRTENLAVRTYFNIGSKSRFEDYQNGTGVFI